MNERYRKLDEFLDSAFRGTPNTVEANEIKLDIAANLRQQYDELIASGTSEEEAFAQTCDSLGDPAELFGIDGSAAGESNAAGDTVTQSRPPLPRVGLRRLLLTVGIFLCAACWLPTAILAVCGASEGWIAAPLFLVAAAGVFCIIYSGTFRPGGGQDRLRNLLVALGVAAEIFCVLPVLVLPGGVGVALMLVLIVLGVGLIIAGGLFRGTSQNGENNDEPPIDPVEKGTNATMSKAGTAASAEKSAACASSGDTAQKERNRPVPLWRRCLWLGILGLYLLLSFLTGAWSVTWILFLVAVVADVGIDNWLKLRNENDRR